MKTIFFAIATLFTLGAQAQTEPLLTTEGLGRCSMEVRQSTLKVICPLDDGDRSIKYLISRNTFKDNQEAEAFCATDSEMMGLDDATFTTMVYFMMTSTQTLADAVNPSYVVVGTHERFLTWAPMSPYQKTQLQRFKKLRDGFLGRAMMRMAPGKIRDQINSSVEMAALTVLQEGDSFSSVMTNLGQLQKDGLLKTIPELPAICASTTRDQLMNRNRQ